MLPTEWKKEIQDSIDEAANRNAESEEAKKARENAIASPLNRLSNEFVGYKEEQSTAESKKRFREIATIWGLYINAFLVLGTAVIFYCQLVVFRETDHTLTRTMIAANRAWIRPVATIGGPLVFDQNGASVTIDFQMTNIGQSPATNVAVHAWLIVNQSPMEEQKRRCDEIRRRPVWLGYSLFPGEQFPASMNVGGFGVSASASPAEIAKAMEVFVDQKPLFLFIVGCVDYSFATDAKNHHQTPFIFNLTRTPPAMFIRPEDKSVEKSGLMLADALMGHGTAD
jgi:hypothetical protein